MKILGISVLIIHFSISLVFFGASFLFLYHFNFPNRLSISVVAVKH